MMIVNIRADQWFILFVSLFASLGCTDNSSIPTELGGMDQHAFPSAGFDQESISGGRADSTGGNGSQHMQEQPGGEPMSHTMAGNMGQNEGGNDPSDARLFEDSCNQLTDQTYPVLPLEWNRTQELYILPGAMPEALSIEYDLWPPAYVEEISLHYDYDFNLDIDSPRLVEACPDWVPFNMFTDSLPGHEDIFSGTFEASDSEGDSIRRARVLYPSGSFTWVINTSNLPQGNADNGDWYALYIPAWGPKRMAMVDAELRRNQLEFSNLPERPGTLILIRSNEPTYNIEHQIITAPTGFAETWHHSSSAIYGRVFSNVPNENEQVELETWISPDEPFGISSASSPVQLTDERPLWLLSYANRERGGRLQIPCGQTLHIRNTGFAQLDIIQQDQRTRVDIGSIWQHTAAECLDDQDLEDVELEVRSLNGQRGFIIARIDEPQE